MSDSLTDYFAQFGVNANSGDPDRPYTLDQLMREALANQNAQLRAQWEAMPYVEISAAVPSLRRSFWRANVGGATVYLAPASLGEIVQVDDTLAFALTRAAQWAAPEAGGLGVWSAQFISPSYVRVRGGFTLPGYTAPNPHVLPYALISSQLPSEKFLALTPEETFLQTLAGGTEAPIPGFGPGIFLAGMAGIVVGVAGAAASLAASGAAGAPAASAAAALSEAAMWEAVAAGWEGAVAQSAIQNAALAAAGGSVAAMEALVSAVGQEAAAGLVSQAAELLATLPADAALPLANETAAKSWWETLRDSFPDMPNMPPGTSSAVSTAIRALTSGGSSAPGAYSPYGTPYASGPFSPYPPGGGVAGSMFAEQNIPLILAGLGLFAIVKRAKRSKEKTS